MDPYTYYSPLSSPRYHFSLDEPASPLLNQDPDPMDNFQQGDFNSMDIVMDTDRLGNPDDPAFLGLASETTFLYDDSLMSLLDASTETPEKSIDRLGQSIFKKNIKKRLRENEGSGESCPIEESSVLNSDDFQS